MKVHQVVHVKQSQKPTTLWMKHMSCFKCYKEKPGLTDDEGVLQCTHYTLSRIDYDHKPLLQLEDSTDLQDMCDLQDLSLLSINLNYDPDLVPQEDSPWVDLNPQEDSPGIDLNPQEDSPGIDLNPQEDSPGIDLNPPRRLSRN
jgi:hypothetical protein